MEKIIGIDLGTSNSSAAVMEGDKPVIIPSAEGTTIVGGKAFPSYVALAKDGQMLVGEPARRQAAVNPEGTVLAAKRKMGTDHRYQVHGKSFTPQQISAFILQKIKRDAEAFLGSTISKAVITVPAYFNDNQRQATKDAGTIAGLEVVRLINEPTAAAFAYGLDKLDREMKFVVFDFGAGTLDVTVMEMMGRGTFKVLATSGDTQLGGTDMDNALLDFIADEFRKDSGIDVRKDPMAAQRIREAAEKAKIELSSTVETDINLPFITADASGPKHLAMKIRRAQLEELVGPIIARCKAPIDQAVSDAKLTRKDIERVIMVGGPTRMPIVQSFVEEYVGVKLERGVDPMECVSIGAAVQGGILSGELKDKDILLLDVTPLSLGVETLGGVFDKVIERNTTVPTKRSKTYTTAADSQPEVEIHVLQGERPMAADNLSLGRFHLTGIPPAPRGTPQIEVTFDIDASGILSVHAKEQKTGVEQSIKITASKKLEKDEIDRMVKQAEQFSAEDAKRREAAETLNKAENLAYQVGKLLKEHEAKIPEADRAAAQDLIDRLKKAVEARNAEEAGRISADLEQAHRRIGETLYRETAQAGAGSAEAGAPPPPPPPQDGGEGTGGPENVVDAEYREEGGKT